MNSQITINAEQRLFVIPCGSGFSSLGFDVCDERTRRIAEELKRPDLMPDAQDHGTLAAYSAYKQAVGAAQGCGRRLSFDLTPQLVGLEGRRVEVVDCHGQRRRFNVGRSGGFIPIHLEIHNRRSLGGGAVTGAPFQSVRIIR